MYASAPYAGAPYAGQPLIVTAGGAITAAFAATEARDTADGAALIGLTGAFAATEAKDTMAAAGNIAGVNITAAFAATEARDTMAAAAQVVSFSDVPIGGAAWIMPAALVAKPSAAKVLAKRVFEKFQDDESQPLPEIMLDVAGALRGTKIAVRAELQQQAAIRASVAKMAAQAVHAKRVAEDEDDLEVLMFAAW